MHSRNTYFKPFHKKIFVNLEEFLEEFISFNIMSFAL